MPINTIGDKSPNILSFQAHNDNVRNIIPQIDAEKDEVSFSGNKENDTDKKRENFLMGGSLLTVLAGVAIGIFDKKDRINKKVPLILDIVGMLMLATSALLEKKSKKQR